MTDTKRLDEIADRANRLNGLAVTVEKTDDRRVVGFEASREECAPSDLMRITSETLYLLSALRTALEENARMRELLTDALNEMGANDSYRDHSVDERIRAALTRSPA